MFWGRGVSCRQLNDFWRNLCRRGLCLECFRLHKNEYPHFYDRSHFVSNARQRIENEPWRGTELERLATANITTGPVDLVELPQGYRLDSRI